MNFEKDALGLLLPIKGYGNKYAISKNGIVFNTITNKQIAQHVTGKGYYYVHLWHMNKGHGRFVHRLLLQASTDSDGFGLECNHIDGDPSNNSIENLEWLTSSENKKHAHHVLGRVKNISKKGIENPNIKAVEGYTANGEVVVRFISICAAKESGFQPSSIAHAIKGKWQKTHRGLFWRYSSMGNHTKTLGWVAI